MQNEFVEQEHDELDPLDGRDMNIDDMLQDNSNEPGLNWPTVMHEYSAFNVERSNKKPHSVANDLGRKKAKTQKNKPGRKPKNFASIERLQNMGFEYDDAKRALEAF